VKIELNTLRENQIKDSNPKARYSIYVIELDPAVLGKNKFLEKNPDFKPGKPCVYVGMTSHSPEKRFEQHKTGYKSGKFVKDYGIRLKPKQYQNHNPMTYEEACKMEREKAQPASCKTQWIQQTPALAANLAPQAHTVRSLLVVPKQHLNG